MADQRRRFIPYEVPLSDGEAARLVLPADLTDNEAERICGVIRALAFEESSPADPLVQQPVTGED